MAQLRAVGLDGDAIAHRARTGRLHRVHRGVYAVGKPATTGLERAMAAVLACGAQASLSHASAAALWGWTKQWCLPCHVAVSLDRRPGGVVPHLVKLAPRDQRRHFGIPVTSPARTILDWAPSLSDRRLSRVVNDARRAEQLSLSSLEDVAVRFSHNPSAKRLMWFVERGGEPTRSGWEDDFEAFCAEYGLPRPEINAIVAGYEVDVLFAPQRVIVELDGWHFHRDRQAFEDDRERDATMLLHDFVTVRMTRRRIEADAAREAHRLHRILRMRSA